MRKVTLEEIAELESELQKLRSQVAELLPWAELGTRPADGEMLWATLALEDGEISQAEYDNYRAELKDKRVLRFRILAGEFGEVPS